LSLAQLSPSVYFSLRTIATPRINNQIQAPEVRVIDEKGQNLGVFSLSDALRLANERGTDLIETAPNAHPPVAKLMDYGKFKYQEARAQRKQWAKERRDVIKTVRLTFGAQIHDLEIKAKKVQELMSEGHRVQIDMRLRGREKAHQDIAQKKIKAFMNLLPEAVEVLQERKTPQGFILLIGKK
jgi:translation initiation factor IF-3